MATRHQVTGPYQPADEDLYRCCPRCGLPIARAEQAARTAAAMSRGIPGVVAGRPTTAEDVMRHTPEECDGEIAAWAQRQADDDAAMRGVRP